MSLCTMSFSGHACSSSRAALQARLQGGTWLPLLEEGHAGIAEIKWVGTCSLLSMECLLSAL